MRAKVQTKAMGAFGQEQTVEPCSSKFCSPADSGHPLNGAIWIQTLECLGCSQFYSEPGPFDCQS